MQIGLKIKSKISSKVWDFDPVCGAFKSVFNIFVIIKGHHDLTLRPEHLFLLYLLPLYPM